MRYIWQACDQLEPDPNRVNRTPVAQDHLTAQHPIKRAGQYQATKLYAGIIAPTRAAVGECDVDLPDDAGIVARIHDMSGAPKLSHRNSRCDEAAKLRLMIDGTCPTLETVAGRAKSNAWFYSSTARNQPSVPSRPGDKQTACLAPCIVIEAISVDAR